MPLWLDAPLQLTFEALERDELRRSEAIGTRVEDLLDGTFSDGPHPGATRLRRSARPPLGDDADDEE